MPEKYSLKDLLEMPWDNLVKISETFGIWPSSDADPLSHEELAERIYNDEKNKFKGKIKPEAGHIIGSQSELDDFKHNNIIYQGSVVMSSNSRPVGKPMDLYFDLDDFSKEEIAMIISFLSEVYESVGGDELEIVGTETFEFHTQPETV